MNKNAPPPGVKAKADAIVQWLKDHRMDRVSEDPEIREPWWEKLEDLYHNAWWHYMTFTKNFVDTKLRLGGGGWERKRSKWGVSSSERCLGSEAAHRNNELGNDVPGGDTITVSELRQFGDVLQHGYGKWIRLVEKEGQYGKFISLESGHTLSDGDGGKDTVTKHWFSAPHDADLLRKISEMFVAAAEQLSKP